VAVIGVSVTFLLALIVVITLLGANRSGAINTLTVILTFVSVIVAIAALVFAWRQVGYARSQEETARRQEVGAQGA
jgi:protein-S-isoprenylcysteine O-methyltransferase Ste14